MRSKAAAAGAERWLADLPQLIAELEERWSLSVGRAYPDPTEAFVAEAVRADGRHAVVKLIVPRDGDAAAHEISVLEAARGDGCVELLDSDVERGALLLERLGPSMHTLQLPLAERLGHLCAAALKMWRPVGDLVVPTGAEKGRWLIDFITLRWDELDRPCGEAAVAHAVTCAERRIAAHDDGRAVLVHGDIHEWNALQSPVGFKLIDPDGLRAEPEYDLGIMMREDPIELRTGDPHERSRWLAARTGLDEVAIWEWGVVERVSTGLLATQVGLQPVGREMLRTADILANA
ncbi:MAG: phosphotransferase [Ilumatobacter sp.]|nr:phosphotransferase [Ilumatobacter sp.]